MLQDINQNDQKMENSGVTSTINHSGVVTPNPSIKRGRSQNHSPTRRNDLFDSGLFQVKRIGVDSPQNLDQTMPLWGQSSATWRQTSPRYSFSRDSRFKESKSSHLDLQNLQLPSSLHNKSCTFGKGRRVAISELSLRNAKLKPSPDRYNLNTFLENTRDSKNGKTFGLPWSAYTRTYITHRKDAYTSHFTQNNPPPIYEVRESPGKDKKKFAMHGRLRMFNDCHADLTKMVPGPVHEINEILVRNTKGLNERNFGFGERIDLAKPQNDFPAPNQYHIKGFCSRFRMK